MAWHLYFRDDIYILKKHLGLPIMFHLYIAKRVTHKAERCISLWLLLYLYIVLSVQKKLSNVRSYCPPLAAWCSVSLSSKPLGDLFLEELNQNLISLDFKFWFEIVTPCSGPEASQCSVFGWGVLKINHTQQYNRKITQTVEKQASFLSIFSNCHNKADLTAVAF